MAYLLNVTMVLEEDLSVDQSFLSLSVFFVVFLLLFFLIDADVFLSEGYFCHIC